MADAMHEPWLTSIRSALKWASRGNNADGRHFGRPLRGNF
jgi:hypothetical protein